MFNCIEFSHYGTRSLCLLAGISGSYPIIVCGPNRFSDCEASNQGFKSCLLKPTNNQFSHEKFFLCVKNNTLCSIALNSLITEPGLYVFWLEFQVVTQLSSAVLIVFRTVKRAIKDLRAEGVSLVL